eukprot:CAMPEP_0202434552 /NCGR_PEP_ID=MMETSP1345-20130828/15501_1 /ASSEMBLY_ACC=CAM_ASM_000843 /TAXON_ID=342563 /ORGANISM="Fabrea Fabrea salina" /LENGTH=135 /DNA_ID=CAMNT_0049047241 /DNA_START=160 /DNA_END=564 /DNA_ORIENTATION=+
MGLWYEAARPKSVYAQEGKCDQFQFTRKQDNVFEMGIIEVRDGEWHSIHGNGYCDKGEATCHVSFSNYWPKSQYQILETDYDKYAVMYTCSSMGLFHWHYAWVLEREIDSVDPDILIQKLEARTGIPRDMMMHTD